MTAIATQIADAKMAFAAPKAHALTPQEVADGWISLFDGETTFGWNVEGEAAVKDGVLVLGGAKPTRAVSTSAFTTRKYRLKFSNSYEGEQSAKFGIGKNARPLGFGSGSLTSDSGAPEAIPPIPCVPFAFEIPAGSSLVISELSVQPNHLAPIFNGKDLAGWKKFTGDDKRAKSDFTVTPEGWINVKNGPGDLQTEKEWKDFVFQGECISNGKHLNSGVFFRCIPGQYQNGYEYQIQNGYKDGDRTKPEDFGTGAIYRRVKARKVVPNDHEWFTMTLIAHGNHIATWVNGYQTVDWTDTRPPNENARNGCKLGAGPISLQGHDKTTDLSFRNLRIAELKKD
jgi:hypothetical protein